MSDRTRVIICWTHLEFDNDAGHQARAAEIAEALDWWSLDSVVVMGDRLACETVAVYGSSLFKLSALRDTLMSCDWKRHREVEVFWKGEEDPSYQHWRMCDDRG